MPDLHHLPANVQLQIYDLFLALHTYQRQRRLDTACAMIKDEIDLDENYEYDRDAEEELLNSLPAVIRNGYKLIRFVWGDWGDYGDAMLTKHSMSLDDNEADVEVLRLRIWNDAMEWHAIYDIHTFEYLTYLELDCFANLNRNMVEVIKLSLGNDAEEMFEDFANILPEEYEQYCQWLNEEKNYATPTFSDDFIKMRSLLHENFSSNS